MITVKDLDEWEQNASNALENLKLTSGVAASMHFQEFKRTLEFIGLARLGLKTRENRAAEILGDRDSHE